MELSFQSISEILRNSCIVLTLKEYIEHGGDNTYKTAILVAHNLEDYEFLDLVVTNVDRYSEDFRLFVSADGDIIVLERGQPLSFLELALLHLKFGVNAQYVIDKINEEAAYSTYNAEEFILAFTSAIDNEGAKF